MLEIYILSGGEVFYQIVNAISAFFNSSSWGMLIRWALNIAILGGIVRFIGTKDLIKLIRWVLIYVFIIGVLIIPKKTVQIIDLSDRISVYKVDNVPVGIAILFSFTTKIGYGIAEIYDQFFSVPDAVSYSKTGFLFGANLAKDSMYASLPNSQLTQNLNGYVTNCVIGDVMLNHKYTLDDLMNSTDTLELITKDASPIRRMIYTQGDSKKNVSCKEAANGIKSSLTGLLNQNGSIIGSLNQITYSDKVNKEIILKELLQESYHFFYKSSKSAVDILKHNVANNAIRKGINSYASKQGDIAGIIAVSTENSQLKSRLNWAISSQIATTYLPLLHTVMLLLLFGLFPIVIILTVSDVMGTRPLKLYALSLVYFMSWLPLFSILNYIMVFYTKSSLNGVEVTLNNTNKIKLIHSDIGMIAGFLSLSIPFLALGIVKGFSAVATNASNFLSGSISGAISQVSSSAGDGNFSIGNMSTENVQGFKWDTNYSRSSGIMSQQLSNGAISTMATDGTTGINTSGIMSYLPTTGSLSKNVSQQFSQAMKYAESMSATALDGLSSSSRNLLSNLSQLQKSLNNSTSYSKGYNQDEISNVKKSVNEAMGILQQYSKAHNLSESEAVSYLNAKYSSGELNVGGSLGAGVQKGVGSANVNLGAAAKFNTFSQDNITHDSREGFNSSKIDSSDLVRRWAYELDKLSSYKLSYNGNKVDNHNQAILDNISSSYEKSVSFAKSYNESQAVSYSLSQERNNITSNGSTITSNLNNEFVKWVQKNHAMNANDILSNTSDSNIARQREELWNEFTNHYTSERINNIMNNASFDFKQKYNQNANQLKYNTGLQSEYNEIKQNVKSNRQLNNENINDNKDIINSSVNGINETQNFNQQVNKELINKEDKESTIEHHTKAIQHKQHLKDVRRSHNEADKDQWFKDPNPVQDSINKKKN